jgi:hypothetical protein
MTHAIARESFVTPTCPFGLAVMRPKPCFRFQKVAGFESSNFDLYWRVLSDR